VGGDGRDYSEIHRFDGGRDFRVQTRIPGAASGCRPDTDCKVEIHRADGLRYEPAPPIELE
jgi:hypothetical protein